MVVAGALKVDLPKNRNFVPSVNRLGKNILSVLISLATRSPGHILSTGAWQGVPLSGCWLQLQIPFNHPNCNPEYTILIHAPKQTNGVDITLW